MGPLKSWKSYNLLPVILMILLSLGSCQKEPINGDLDGRWQILEIETEEGAFNVKNQQLYYNFSLHVCNLSYYGGIFTEGNLSYENNIIKIYFPYIETPAGMALLETYGIYSNPVIFRVVYIDKKKLIIQNDESLVILRKF